jgi:hypothetical protein
MPTTLGNLTNVFGRFGISIIIIIITSSEEDLDADESSPPTPDQARAR